jgi:BMFP domain-containing protein YqiC
MISAAAIEDVARRLAELVPPDARAARDDLVANFREVLRGARSSMHSAACCCARARWSKRSRCG